MATIILFRDLMTSASVASDSTSVSGTFSGFSLVNHIDRKVCVHVSSSVDTRAVSVLWKHENMIVFDCFGGSK